MQKIFDIIIKSGIPENFIVLFQSQIKNSKLGLDHRQRRWNPQVISVCLSLYCRSPQAYQDLGSSGMLILPSKRLLQYYKNSVKQSPGLVEKNFEWMKKEADKQNIIEHGRRGGLLIDEMTIQDDLQFVRDKDVWSLVGSVDMGEVNNNIDKIISGHEVKMASHCLQYVFRGFSGFRWPVAYYGSETACAYQLYNTFWDVVSKLFEYGFHVDYVNMDGATTNRLFMAMMSSKNLREENFIVPDIFDLDHKICLVQDIKHTLKKIRNNFNSSKPEFKSQPGRYIVKNSIPILWTQWEEAFKFNTEQDGIPIHKRLSEEHIILTPVAKMRNKLACDVLDKEMLFLMKSYQSTIENPEKLSSTIEVLEKTAIIVEIFHDNRPIIALTDQRLIKLREILIFFTEWEEEINKNKAYNATKNLMTIETRDDLHSSIQGFLSLCELTIGSGKSINPSFINSDLIENHFCQQRGVRNGLNTNPTLAQIGPAQTAICLSQTTVSAKSNSGTSASFFKATTPCALNPQQNKKSRKQ